MQMIQRRRGSSRQVEIYPEDILNVLIPPLADVRKSIAKRWHQAVKNVSQSSRAYPEAEAALLKDLHWHALAPRNKNNYRAPIEELRSHNRFDSEFFKPSYREMDNLFLERDAILFSDTVAKHIKGVQPEAYLADGEIVVLKSKDVVRAGIDVETCDRTSAKYLEWGRGSVRAGVLVTNMTGVGTLGRAGVVPSDKRPIVISVDVAGWRLKKDVLSAEYLALFLNSPAGMSQSIRYQIGSSGQLHLYPQHVMNFRVHVRRTRGNRIDQDWHESLTAKVRSAAAHRRRAYGELRSIHREISTIIGVHPRLLRE
jgi:hypothetical protein